MARRCNKITPRRPRWPPDASRGLQEQPREGPRGQTHCLSKVLERIRRGPKRSVRNPREAPKGPSEAPSGPGGRSNALARARKQAPAMLQHGPAE
eukprot:5416582-Pyramimonas_sp.AAC.1